MARGRRFRTRTVTVFRRARPAFSRARSGIRRVRGSRGFKFGGGLLDKTAMSLGKGTLYGGIAQKIFPGVAPIATLYGEYAGGGLEGLAINEFLVKPFLGMQSTLPNLLGGLGLGNLFGGGQSSMQTGMNTAV